MTNALPRMRSVTVSTKVSEEENAQLEELAEARGLTMSEWRVARPLKLKLGCPVLGAFQGRGF